MTFNDNERCRGYKDVSASDNGLLTQIQNLPGPVGLTNWQDALEQTKNFNNSVTSDPTWWS